MTHNEDKSVNWESRNAECKEHADPHQERACVRLNGKVSAKAKEEPNVSAPRLSYGQDVLGATKNEVLSKGI